MALVWFLVALIALVGELLTLSFYLVYEAAAAVVTGLVALVWPNSLGDVVVFAVCSALSLGVLRPRTIELLFRVRPQPTVAFPDVAGKAAVVRERVTDGTGLIEVGSGEFWSARAAAPGRVYEPGTRVVVSHRDGIRLFVTLPEEGTPQVRTTEPEP